MNPSAPGSAAPIRPVEAALRKVVSKFVPGTEEKMQANIGMVHILLKDKEAEKGSSVMGVPVPRQLHTTTCQVLQGELVAPIPATDISPRSDGQNAHNYRTLHKDSATFYDDGVDVAPLTQYENGVLAGVASPSARYGVFLEKDKLDWGTRLRKGDRVLVEMPGLEAAASGAAPRASAVIRYVGEVKTLSGITFGVDIQDRDYLGWGSTDGTFHDERYFTCKDGNGMFVSVEKLSRHPAVGSLSQPPPSSQHSTSHPQPVPRNRAKPKAVVGASADPQSTARYKFKKDDRVVVFSKKGTPIHGVVKWIGMYSYDVDKKQIAYKAVGVETDVKMRSNEVNGLPVKGHYFTVNKGKSAVFISEKEAILEADFANQPPERPPSPNLPLPSQVQEMMHDALREGEPDPHPPQRPPRENEDDPGALARVVGVRQTELLQQNREALREIEERKRQQELDQVKQAVPDQSLSVPGQELIMRQISEEKNRDAGRGIGGGGAGARERESGGRRQSHKPDHLYDTLAETYQGDPLTGRAHYTDPCQQDPRHGQLQRDQLQCDQLQRDQLQRDQQQRDQQQRDQQQRDQQQRDQQQRDQLQRDQLLRDQQQRDQQRGQYDPQQQNQYQNGQVFQPDAGQQHQGLNQQGPHYENPQQYPAPTQYGVPSTGTPAPTQYGVPSTGTPPLQHPPPQPHQPLPQPQPRQHHVAYDGQQGSAPPSGLEVGSAVQIANNDTRTGVIRWIGTFPSMQGVIAGVELDEPMEGCGNGEWGGYQYFNCPLGRALFCPLTNLRADTRLMQHSEAAVAAFGNPLQVPDWEEQDQAIPGDQIKKYTGDMRGIQGHQNSCYLDATIFGLFALSDVFDSLFLDSDVYKSVRDPQAAVNDTPATQVQREVSNMLWRGIVNPLRKNGAVRFESVMRLRSKLEELGKMEGIKTAEKDPEEFLNMLFKHTLNVGPFIHIKRPFGTEPEFFVQLFVEFDETLKTPTVEILLHRMFKEQQITFAEFPSKLLVQVPRYGKQFKTFKRIIPGAKFNPSPLMDCAYECFICGESAWMTCVECKAFFQEDGDKVHLCKVCCDRVHSHKKRTSHKCELEEAGELELLSVLCIETSHYVCFTQDPDGRWLFFDSMADRLYDQYNIPRGVDCTAQLNEWVYGGNTEKLMAAGPRDLPELVRRFTQDIYMCVYIQPDYGMYK